DVHPRPLSAGDNERHHMTERDSRAGEEGNVVSESTMTEPDANPVPAAAEPRDNVIVAWLVRMAFYGALAALVILMMQDLPREVIGGLGLGLTVVLLLMKVPVGVAMIIGSAVGIWALSDSGVLASTMRLVPHSTVAGWSFSVIPMFVLMGLLLWRSGASERLYTAA